MLPRSPCATARQLAILVAVVLVFTSACGLASNNPTFNPPLSTSTDPVSTPPSPSPSALPLPSPTLAAHRLAAPPDPAQIKGSGTSFFGWVLLDRGTGTLTGSANLKTGRNTLESMIKPWLAADYLRRLAAAGRQPTEKALSELALMIVDSNDPLAEKYYQIGGEDAVMRRLSTVCGLSHVVIVPDKWSFSTMTIAEAAAYGLCLADGRGAGPSWTSWILDTMKNVRGTVSLQKSGAVEGGRWGIIDALPPDLASQTSIKNGWTSYVDGWHVNCLAVHPDWVLAIMMRRKGSLVHYYEQCSRFKVQG